MQAIETQQDPKAKKNRFISVVDGRNRKVRGLWVRNGAFYQQMWVKAEKSPRRVRLKATTLEAAKKEMASLTKMRDDGDLPSRGAKPFFDDYAREYIVFLKAAAAKQGRAGTFHKSPATIHKEECNLDAWIKHIGHVRIDQITRPMLGSFIEKRLGDGINPRTVNLDIIIVRNVFKRAVEAGYLRTMPTAGIKPLRWTPPRREMLRPADIERLFTATAKAGRNGAQLNDFLRFLAFSGAREQDALQMKWESIDLDREQLRIHMSKNRKTMTLDFNPALKALLVEMHARRAPDSEFLFPSPRRGAGDMPIANFRAAFNTARTEAKLPAIGFHDLRHYFASICVMNGTDFMTVASWLGHKDGGVLVGKVYGHLLDEHKRRAAQRLVFAPSIVAPAGRARTKSN